MIEENKEEYQKIIDMVNKGKYVEAEETFKDLLTNEIVEKLKEKKDEMIEKIKIGNITENENTLDESNTWIDKFVEKLPENKLIKIPISGETKYEGKYIYFQKDVDEYSWYLLNKPINDIKEIKKKAIKKGEGYKKNSQARDVLNDVLNEW